jgi:GAF domain-containing protein
VLDAIVAAATIVGAADACELQLHDPHSGALHLVRRRGLSDEFLRYFASPGRAGRTACGIALATGEPVIVNEVRRSAVYAGTQSLPVLLAAGIRALQSHPLRDEAGVTIAVLTLYYRTAKPGSGQPELVAWWAARVLDRAARQAQP